MKKLSYLLFFFVFVLPISAQTQEEQIQKSEQLLKYVIEGKGSDAFAMLNEKVRAAVSAEQLGGMWKSLEGQFGKLKKKGEWQTNDIGGQPIIFVDLAFELYSLRFITAFDKDGLANTIRFAPSPIQASVVNVQPDTSYFKESEIKVCTGKFELPGILCMPKVKENVPVAILLHGSGPNDRDETIGPNKVFRDLAWGLAKEGIASIRYDKRTNIYGTRSTAEGEGLTLNSEVVDDAVSAIMLAKSLKQINPEKIYLVGHSLGAMLAPLVATRCKQLKGIIMMSGNARSLEDLLPEQVEYITSLDGLSAEEEKQLKELKTQVANVKKLGKRGYDSSISLPLGLPASYWKDLNTYKQTDVARKLTLPILILQGERDYQVTMEDYNMWFSVLHNRPNVTFKLYPKLNHLYREGTGKSTLSEYMKPGEMPQYVVKDIADWIKK